MCVDCQNHVSEESLKAKAENSIKSYDRAPLALGFDNRSIGDEPMLATAAAPMNEIPYALMMQDQANDRLSKAVEILHGRTAGIRHSGVERGEEDRAVRDYGSETARLIGDQANRTDMAARVIEKILTEMEI